MLDRIDLEMISEIVTKSIEPVKEDVKEIKSTLNETNKKLDFIIGIQSDLSRKLDELIDMKRKNRILLENKEF